MKKIYLLIYLLIFLLNNKCYASDFTWPNANEFKYPEYEVNFMKDLQNSLDEHRKKLKLKEFILGYYTEIDKLDFNKILSISVINKIKLCVTENLISVINDPDIAKFIQENETSHDYDDQSAAKKIIAWIFLQYGPADNSPLKDSESYVKLRERRHVLLQNIADNNKRYAPAALYLKIVIDRLPLFKYSPKLFTAMIEKYDKLIESFSEIEIGTCCNFDKARQYLIIPDYEKAFLLLEEIIKKNKNFYHGSGDFYSNIYKEMVDIYIKQKNKEKAKYFLDRINKNYKNYEEYSKDKLNEISNL